MGKTCSGGDLSLRFVVGAGLGLFNALLHTEDSDLACPARAEISGEKPVDVRVRRQIRETCETA